MNTYILHFPPVRVVGQDPTAPLPAPFDAWLRIKDKKLEEIFSPQLSKIRVTSVTETPLITVTKGEETDEQIAFGASLRTVSDTSGVLGDDGGRGGHELQVDADDRHACRCGAVCGERPA